MKKIFLLLFICFCLNLFAEGSKSLKEQNVPTKNVTQRVFSDIEDEYILVRYFLTSNQKRYFKSLNEEGRNKYIESFWQAQDTNPVTEKNEFLEEIKARAAYCNHRFTHFKPGWKTDRGRIYIKHGEPYEILKETTGFSAKYPQKEYQIWKYRITSYLTYIFIDLQQHGDYRLIFSDGDDAEGFWADWLNYLGPNFDEGLLY
ncbi:MAG: GWxTD domain-containing protein [Candidatus Cloacimonetes bacterium]|nr:GWxTD domain-containing protein [Candidatus Cloacimonadota bacterium]